MDVLTLSDTSKRFFGGKDQYLFIMVCSVTPGDKVHIYTIVSTTMIAVMKADIKRLMYQGIHEWKFIDAQSIAIRLMGAAVFHQPDVRIFLRHSRRTLHRKAGVVFHGHGIGDHRRRRQQEEEAGNY